MAKRQLSSIQIDGTEYNLSILSDYSVFDSFVVYGEFENSLAEYPATKNTDFAPIKADATTTTNYDTNLVAKFQRYVRNQEKAIMWYYGSYPMQYVAYNGSTTHVYYSITLDDDEKKAWVTAIVYQNNAFEKNIVDYGGEDLYNAFYLPYVPPTPPGPQGDATCKIKYYLPANDYTYSKITFKEDTAPIDVNDGYSIDISQNDSEINIEGLVEATKYYFTIFTDKSESESFPYIIGLPPGPPPASYGEIRLLYAGRICRDDSLVSDPYVREVRDMKTASCILTGSGYEMTMENDEIHSGLYTLGFYTELTGNNTPTTSTRTYKPIIYSGSQEGRTSTLLVNKLRVKFNIKVTIPPTDSEYRFKPAMETTTSGGSSYVDYQYFAHYLNDKTYVVDNQYILSSTTQTVSINETGLEMELSYYDYNTERVDPSIIVHLQDTPNCLFSIKITITEMTAIINDVVLPRPDKRIQILTSSSSYVYWTIDELYRAVTALGFNSFLLEPRSGSYSTTRYWIVPLNLTIPESLYTARDKYATDADGYYAFGIETDDALSSLDVYYSGTSSEEKYLQKGTTKVTFNFTKTKDGHTYKYRRSSYASGRYSFMFYTKGYKDLYINNKLFD